MTEAPDDARAAIDELHSVGGDELVSAMMHTFVRFAESQLRRMDDAQHNGDLEAAALIAQSVKSNARQLGARALGEVSAAAEVAARGGDAAALSMAAEEMHREFAAARRWMDALAVE